MFCPNCGTEMLNGAAFCGNCGTRLADFIKEEPAVPAAEPVVEAVPVAEPVIEAAPEPAAEPAPSAFEFSPAQPTVEPVVESTPEIKFTPDIPAEPVPEPAPVFQTAQPVPVQNQQYNQYQNTQQNYNQYQADQQFSAIDDNSTLVTVIKIFLIIGCVAQGWMIIPLAWCLPITIISWKKLNRREPVGMGLKICTLLFVSLVSGICMLCMKDEKRY